MSLREQPMSLNMAKIVHRLMADPKGWRLDSLLGEFNIKERTYRKYRKVLMDAFPGGMSYFGGGRISEVKDGDCKYLRIVDFDESQEQDSDFISRMVSLYLARSVFSFLPEIDLRRLISRK